MSITLDLPEAVLQTAARSASSEGLSLEEFITRLLVESAERKKPNPDDKFGLFLGSVVSMAEDFNDTPEDFRDYVA